MNTPCPACGNVCDGQNARRAVWTGRMLEPGHGQGHATRNAESRRTRATAESWRAAIASTPRTWDNKNINRVPEKELCKSVEATIDRVIQSCWTDHFISNSDVYFTVVILCNWHVRTDRADDPQERFKKAANTILRYTNHHNFTGIEDIYIEKRGAARRVTRCTICCPALTFTHCSSRLMVF